MSRFKGVFAAASSAALVLFTAGPGTAGTWQPDIDTVYAVGPGAAYVAQWNGPSGRGWTGIGPGTWNGVIPGSLGVFAVLSDKNIYEYGDTPGQWTLIGGPGARFVQAAGHLFGLAPDKSYVAEWNGPGQGWTIVSGAARDIEGGPAGLVETGGDGNEYLYDGAPGAWSEIGTDPSAFYDVGKSAIYRVLGDSTEDIQRWNGGQSWTKIGDQAAGVLENNEGVFKRNLDLTISVYDGTPGQWTVIGGAGSSFAVSQTDLYGLAPDQSYVARWNGPGQGWTVIGGKAAQIYAGE
jgi:hypothetical protein